MTREEIDCISREQAKAFIRDKFKDLPSRVEINTILNELPSVTPTRKKGKWENLASHHFYNDVEIETAELRCSCCNEIVEWDIELPHKPYYCENCGADMREVEE